LLKKSLAVGIIVFLVISSVPYSILSNEISTGTFDGNTLYVGGTSPGNYSRIQDAIDNASDGDMVFVYSGTYFENVIVDKSIVLVGKDRNSTIIDGLNKSIVIHVKVESVSIESFTIRNGTNGVYNYYDKTIISHNIIINNDKGIKSSYSKNVNITGNIISKNNYGITFYRTYDSIIKGNHILSNKKIGILFDLATIPGLGCENNTVTYNIIQKNTMGIYLSDSPYNNINYNNFYQNIVDASFEYSVGNNWNHNYWNRPRILPKPVIGTIYYYFPWVNFDWHPARESYGIRVLLEVGPYTQNVDDNNVTIVWESSIPTINNRVKYGKNTSYRYVEYGSSGTIHHEITISPPFTSGHYKVVSDGMESGDFEFRLASHCYSTQEFKCVIFGDSRGTWDNYVHATEVANAVNAEFPNFVIHGGDMVDDGRVQIQWDSWLALMGPLMQNSTLFGVIGNHERKCSRYYEIFSLPNNEMWYSFDYGPCHFTILDNYGPWNVDSSQYEWLEDDLSSTDLPFKFVCFHEPIYCSGGHSPRTDVRAVWEPIFNNYNVTLVFQSHCHYYQRTNNINGTIYIVSGGAGAPLYTPNDAWFVNNSQKTYHYCVLDVSLATMEITFSARYVNGTTFDEFIVCPPVVS